MTDSLEEKYHGGERGDRSEGQIEKMMRGDVRDSEHNRDTGTRLLWRQSCPKKKTELPSQKLRYVRDCIYTYII